MQAGNRARNAYRLIADVVDPAFEHVAVTIRRLAYEDRRPLVLAHERPRGAVELEQRVTGLRAVDKHHSAAAEAAHLWVDHALHERARDRGVDSVAASPQDVEPDLCGPRLRAT